MGDGVFILLSEVTGSTSVPSAVSPSTHPTSKGHTPSRIFCVEVGREGCRKEVESIYHERFPGWSPLCRMTRLSYYGFITNTEMYHNITYRRNYIDSKEKVLMKRDRP